MFCEVASLIGCAKWRSWEVTSAANNGSSVVVSTTPATLADEVTQAHFSVDVPLSLTSTSAARKHKGYAIRTGKLAATQAAGSPANSVRRCRSVIIIAVQLFTATRSESEYDYLPPGVGFLQLAC